MSRKERAIAALLLAVAVIGGALIPRLLASPSAPLGIALGPGPGRSVVQAPALPKPAPRTGSRAAPPRTSRVSSVLPAWAVALLASVVVAGSLQLAVLWRRARSRRRPGRGPGGRRRRGTEAA